MAVVNKFNVNKQQVTLDADIIENMSANDVSYDASVQYNKNTIGDKLSYLEEEVNGEETETMHKTFFECRYVSINGVVDLSGDQFFYCEPISIVNAEKIKVKACLSRSSFGGIFFTKVSTVATNTNQAVNIVRALYNTGTGNENIEVVFEKEELDEIRTQGGKYVYIGALKGSDKYVSVYERTSEGIKGDITRHENEIGSIKLSINDLIPKTTLLENKVTDLTGGEITTLHTDEIFANTGFVSNDGGVSTLTQWKYSNPLSILNVLEIKTKCDLSNGSGGGVEFLKSDTVSKASAVGNVGSGTGTYDGEIIITSEQISNMISLGATHFVVTKKADYQSFISVKSLVEGVNEKISKLSKEIRQTINILRTDGEIDIYNKLLYARNTKNCDVIWQFGEYIFTDVVFNHMKTIEEHKAVGAYEIPLGGGCRYYFNGSTIKSNITTYEGICNVFGCVRKNCGDYYLYDGIIESNNTCYCVHDEGQGDDGTYIHEYHNMTMIQNSTDNDITKCIGGGTGKYGKAIIDSCLFVNNNPLCPDDCSWHGLTGANADAVAYFEIVSKNNYFSKRLYCQSLGNNQTAKVFYCGNSSAAPLQVYAKWEKYSFCNEVRN